MAKAQFDEKGFLRHAETGDTVRVHVFYPRAGGMSVLHEFGMQKALNPGDLPQWQHLGRSLMPTKSINKFFPAAEEGTEHHASIGGGLTVRPEHLEKYAGLRLAAEEMDWRPNEALPEDFYALARKRRNVKITSIEDGDRQYELLRLARQKKEVSAGPSEDFGIWRRWLRSALSIALQDEARARGVPFESSGQLTSHLDRYGEAIQHFASRRDISKHPKIQGLIGVAQRLTAPEEAGKDEAGREELTGVATQPSLREIAGQIRRSGLLTAADAYLSKKYEDHVPFAHYNPKVRGPRPQGFVELPQSMLTHDPLPHEVRAAVDQALPGTIKPATDETVRPASLAPAAKKALRESIRAEAGEQTAPAEDAPLPLAESPEEMKGMRHKDRHRLIASMIVKSKPADIIQALIKKFEISPRAAKGTLNRWIETRRLGLHSEDETSGGPVKLARAPRKGQTDPSRHTQVADLSANVHPLIAGTRLALHLIQIAKEHAPIGQSRSAYLRAHPEVEAHGSIHPDDEIHSLAVAALTGKSRPGLNEDVFAKLGERLGATEHRYAKLYNWQNVGRGLRDMQMLRQFLAENVQRREGMSDRHFYAQALRQFARDKESKERGYKDQSSHDEFWRRLKGEAKDRPSFKGESNFDKRMTDALYRLHTLADDRETTGEIDASKDRDWRQQTALAWGNKHMKFSRTDLATLAILAHLNPRVRNALTNRGFKFKG